MDAEHIWVVAAIGLFALSLVTIEQVSSNKPKPTNKAANLKEAVKRLQATNETLTRENFLTKQGCEEAKTTIEELLKEQEAMGARLGALEREKNAMMQGLECSVCCERQKCIVLEPCRHFALCRECSERVRTCPICAKVIRERRTVFVS